MSRRMKGSILAFSILLGVQFSAAAVAADADNGRLLAERWCRACHIVDSDQASATTDAPPFSVIAKKPDFDSTALAFFLLHPHPKMPDVGLSRDAASDLAAFIASKRQ